MNRSKWLRLPMALLSQLLWKKKFDHMYQEKIQNLPARDTQEYMDHEEDYEASYAMALKATKSVFVRKELEIAVIANPDNGSDFFRLCISFPSWAHHKKVKGKEKSSSDTINQPKDAHSPTTAKGRPPRTAKGRPSTSKKRPHPAISELFESLEEQFELLSREDAEDSRHADSEQQSDSRRSSPSGRSRSQGSRQSSPSRQSRSQGSRWSSPARGSRSRDSQARTSDTARSHPSGADLDDSEATKIKPIYLAVLCDIDNIRRVICDRKAPQEGLQDIRKLLGSLSYTRHMDPNVRLGGVRLMWADLPTHCKVDAGFGGVPLWNVFTDGIVQSVFTIAAEFLLDDGTLVVACRAKHLFKVISEVATLIVAMFVRDLDGPLPVPFYDCRADDIVADIDGYEADSDMLREPLGESSWTLDTSGPAFRSDVEKSEFLLVGDAVLDCLARCGSMAIECERLHRHCISIEKDVVVFRSLLFPQQRLPGEVGTVLHYGHFSRSEELERATSLQPPVQPPISHFYLPPIPQPPGIAQWLYGPSYPPPYTFIRPHFAWPPVMSGRPPLQRPLFAPPPMEPPPPPGQYPHPPPPQL
ncbi:hypothetical protein L7F22_014597 [Adiantum nelumboides]|nr:hypothetical protein [Adiantum nelumboides]